MTASFWRTIPVILVLCLFFWMYFAFMGQLYMYNVYDLTERICYSVFFNILFALTVWSYFSCSFTQVCEVPPPYKLPIGMIDILRNLQDEQSINDVLINYCRTNKIRLWTRTDFGYIRYCYKCKCVKPDRAHHCRQCDICILKMDHHCPWMNTCINFSNYKMFVLFNIYCSILCIFCCASSLRFVIIFFNDLERINYSNLHYIIGFFICGIIGILTIIISIYHIWLTCQNKTTLEHLKMPTFLYSEQLTFGISRCFNWKEVFGDGYMVCWTWYLPTRNECGDGLEFYTAFE